MRATSLFSLLAALGTTSARLVGISAPTTISPASHFSLILRSENYIQSVADVSVAWGYAPVPGFFGTIGSSTGSAYLGPDKSNQLHDVTLELPPPQGLTMGSEYVLGVALTSLYGASGTPTITLFNVTVKLGNAVAGERVNSTGFESFTAYS